MQPILSCRGISSELVFWQIEDSACPPVVTSVPSKPSGTIQYNTMQNTLETIAASSTQCITMKFTFERYSIMQTLQFKELYALLYQVELTRDKYTEFYKKG